MNKLFPVDDTIFYLYIWQNYSCIWNTGWLISTPKILFPICISGRTIAVFGILVGWSALLKYYFISVYLAELIYIRDTSWLVRTPEIVFLSVYLAELSYIRDTSWLVSTPKITQINIFYLLI